MTREEAIKRIRDFGLYHAIEDLPHSTKTVEAFKMAIQALEEPEVVQCKDCRFSSTYFYCGELNWTCNNVENGLGRDVSEDGYCYCAERRADG